MSLYTFYAVLLHKIREGLALYLPKPCDDLPEPARRDGTQIGAVGVVTDDGYFDTIFNILCAEDDPANRFGVPANFEQVILRPHDIRIRRLQHPPGTVLSNTVVGKKRLDLQASFGTNPQKLALVVLPDGASKWDVRSEKVFQEYAKKHARSWYAFVNGDLQRIVGNGGLYLVTGVTKSTSWDIAAVDHSASEGTVSL
ncbi:hypothetical protein B0H17DRAFT_989841, partial [Mycena rosella]